MEKLTELLRKNNLAESIIESLPAMFYIQDREGKIVFWNKILEMSTGYTHNELYGRHYLDFFRPEDHDKVKKVNEMAFNYGYSEAESKIIIKDLEERNVHMTGNRFEFNGSPYIIGIVHDISVRIMAEDELKKALKENIGLKEELQKENIYLREEINSNLMFDEIIGQNKKLQAVFQQIRQVAQTDASVLVQGETGTGKELIARAIHKLSDRNKKPLVKLNCASIPSSLLESELFGHEKGAFTGAFKQKLGRFEIADGGTLFLDEIGEMPIELQPKLLRVLQDGEFERVGSNKTIKTNIRIISATNRLLENEVENGNFRNDLFFRLNVFPINLPSLRERADDIPILVNYFLKKFSQQHKKDITKVNAGLMRKLQQYSWPGNIRELQNVIERAVITSTSKSLQNINILLPNDDPNKIEKLQTLREVEKQQILKTLDYTNWRIRGKNGAAELLDIKPTTLDYRMKRLGISRT